MEFVVGAYKPDHTVGAVGTVASLREENIITIFFSFFFKDS